MERVPCKHKDMRTGERETGDPYGGSDGRLKNWAEKVALLSQE